MRAALLACAVLATLTLAVPATGAPTCQNQGGDTVRCGTSGAMPVGWTASPAKFEARRLSHPPGASTNEVVTVFVVIVLFLAMIALLPDFDGSRGEDWDAQDGDETKRR